MAGKFLSRKMMSAIRRRDRTNSTGNHITICGCGGEDCFYSTKLRWKHDLSPTEAMIVLEQFKRLGKTRNDRWSDSPEMLQNALKSGPPGFDRG